MTLNYAPLIPLSWIIACLAPLAIMVLISLILRRRGALLRLAALVALTLALFNPQIEKQEREALTTIIPVVIDYSPSQSMDNRQADSEAALAQLREQLAVIPNVEIRAIEADRPTDNADKSGAPSTRLFHALNEGIRDLPPSRIGGAIMITDGQVHDVVRHREELGFDAPVYGLISGNGQEFDRSIEFIHAPRFGLTGRPQKFSFVVNDTGLMPHAQQQVDAEIRINGTDPIVVPATIGQETSTEITLPHAGNNIIEISVAPLEGEVTPVNNQAVAMVEAIRENLRVLLVSGEPNNGERTWRNLLKSDTGVDLVHFTILRPPEKQDDTPISELSLIVFPTRELFVDKVEEFDLIIFDRYQHRDVLPLLYYDYIAQYVQNGGALLIAAGPEFSGAQSIARTPLLSALPALPTGTVSEKAFYPRLTETGQRHPVTRGLEGSTQEPPQWGRWFRSIDISTPQGDVVMQAADDKPLLTLSRQGKGRVGLLLSDQSWLWARDFEGGGPYASLYRRMAHWLMQEPELEEEALTAKGDADHLTITRQTMSDKVAAAKVTTPSGKTISVELAPVGAGLFSSQLSVEETGLYKIESDGFSTLAHVGAIDTPELKDSISTTEKLEPISLASAGQIFRLRPLKSDMVTVPPVNVLDHQASGNDKANINLLRTSDTTLIAMHHIPLFGGLLSLAALLLIISAMWYREGR